MGSMVKSVEFIEIAQTGILSSIDLTKNQIYENCVPFMTLHGDSDYMDSHCMDVYFDGTTTSGVVNFKRNETRGVNMNIKCYVVEFEPTEVKVQHGSFTGLPGGVTTAYTTTLGFVQTKTAMVHYWSSTTGEQYWPAHLVRGRVSGNGTQVDMYRYRSSGTVSGHYFLFEDISVGNDHFSVNHQTITMTGTSSSPAAPSGTPGGVDLTKTFCIGSYACTDANSGYNDRQTCRLFVYLTGVYRIDRANSSGTIYYQIQFITFLDDSKLYIVHNRDLGVGTPTTVGTIGLRRTCNLDTSCIIATMPMGQCRGSVNSTAGRTQLDSLWMSLKLASNTAMQYERNSDGGGQASYTGFAVVDWAGVEVSVGSNPSPLDPSLSVVKSIENISMTVYSYWDMVDLTKGQDISNCVLFTACRGESAGNYIRQRKCIIWLREPGVIVAHRTDASGDAKIEISVVEFYPDQVKVQSGHFRHYGTTTVNSTIEEVSTDKAFILSNWETNDATYWSRTSIRSRFTSSTNVELYRNNSGNYVEGYFYIIEDLGDNFRVTHWVNTMTGSSYTWYTSEYHEYYSTLMLASYASTTNAYYVDRGCVRLYSYGLGNRLTMDRNSSSDTIYASCQYIRFLDRKRRIQYFVPSYNTSTTQVIYDISSAHAGNEDYFSTFNSIQNDVGRGTGTGADDVRGVFNTLSLINNNTQIDCRREATVGITLYSSYSGLIDWKGVSHPESETGLNNTQSLVRSIEKLEYTGGGRLIHYYMTKGQQPENCVPFASWRVGANDGHMTRIMRAHYMDGENSRLIGQSGGGQSGGNLDEIIYLVEFDPGQVRVQQLYGHMTGTSFNFNLSEPVVRSKTFIWFSYAVDNYNTSWRVNALTASFPSDTQVNFARYASAGSITITLYLVECLQEQWYVTHTDTGSQTGTSFYDYVNFHYPSGGNRHRFVQGSYSSSTASYYVDRGCMRFYPRAEHGFQWDRNSSSDTITDRHSEFIEFNPAYGIRVGGYWTDLSSGQTSETKSIVNDVPLDLTRSMVCPTVAGATNRGTGTGADDVGSVCVKFELTDSTTITCSRYDKGITTYGWFQWVEWPPFKNYYFEGTVSRNAVPVIRNVSCFRSDTFELMDSTMSASGTGFYRLGTSYSGVHYIICQDDDDAPDYNDLILGKMEPYPFV